MPSIMSRATWSRLLTGLVIVSLLATLLVPASRQAEAAGLYVGATAVVSGTLGLGLHLRTSPSTSATSLGKNYDGTIVTVSGGPISAEGYVWWLISTPIGVGWSADNWLVVASQSCNVSIPSTPSGPTSGSPNTSYTFFTGGAACSMGHSVQYGFSWGDGTSSTWSTSSSASKSWSSSGTYQVLALARCGTNGSVVSTWSSGLTVAISQATPPPVVASTNPVSGDIAARITSTITATFDKDVVAATNSVTVVEGGGASVPVSGVSVSGRTLTITLSSPMKYRTGYGVTINAGAVRDLSGNPSAAYSWVFISESTVSIGKPVLSSPGNGATGVPVNTTLNWNAVSGATGYVVQVARDQSFANMVLNQAVPSASCAVSLSAGTQYYWRVVAGAGGEVGPLSDVWGFTTAANTAPPPVVANTNPVNGDIAARITSTITATFDKDVVAATNSVTVVEGGGASVPVSGVSVSGRTLTITLSSPMKYRTGYGVTINAGAVRDLSGNPNAAYSWTFLSESTVSIGKPVLSSPGNGATGVPVNTTLNWNVVSGAAYVVHVAQDQSFTNMVLSQAVPSASCAVSLSAGTQYYWRVIAGAGGEVGPWSDVWGFTTGRQAEAAGLYVGAAAVVTGTLGMGLHLRTSPSSLAPSLGKNYDGTVVTVIGGPTSAEGFVWWLMSTPIGVGWSADNWLVVASQSCNVSIPSTPSGPSSGATSTSYSFSTGGSSCSGGHGVQYGFSWGDGTSSVWSSSSSASKSWSSSGTYQVQATARCTTNTSVTSSWSSSWTVTISSGTVSAAINSWDVSPSSVSVGQSVTLSVNFTNTGSSSYTFIAGATLWRPTSGIVNFERSVTLSPGQSTTASWDQVIDEAGSWYVQFAVWLQKPFTSGNLLSRAPSPSQQAVAATAQPGDSGVALPQAPVALTPGSTTEPGPAGVSLTPQFTWRPSTGADYYDLAVSVYPYESSNIIYSPQFIQGTSITVPAGVLQAGARYRWNMRAHSSAGWSGLSATLYFQTEPPPAAPPPLPDAGGSLSPDGPHITSLEPQSGAQGDLVKVAGTHLGDWRHFGGKLIFGFIEARIVSYDDSLIVARIPFLPITAKSTVVSVKVRDFMGAESNSVQFTYLPPHVDDITPSGYKGARVVIRGRNFGEPRSQDFIPGTEGLSVKFGATSALIQSWHDTEIVVLAPEDYGTGMARVEMLAFFALATHKLSSEALKALDALEVIEPYLPKLGGLTLDENEPWWVSLAKVAIALSLPFVEIRPSQADVVVVVRTSAGESEAKLFTYCDLVNPYEGSQAGSGSIFTPAEDLPGSPTVFQVGSTQYVDGETQAAMDCAPYIHDGRVFAPIRYVASALDVPPSGVHWDPLTGQVSILAGRLELQMQEGSKCLTVNGNPLLIDSAPELLSGRLFVPLRCVAEALGYGVKWLSPTVVIKPAEELAIDWAVGQYGSTSWRGDSYAFVRQAFSEAGVTLPQSPGSWPLEKQVPPPRGALVVYSGLFAGPGGTPRWEAAHVGISLGDGAIVHVDGCVTLDEYQSPGGTSPGGVDYLGWISVWPR